MSSYPPPRQPRTARERVARRRSAQGGAQGARPASPRRGRPRGCNTALVGGALLLAILGVVAAVVIGRARSTLQTIEQADPRQQAPASAGVATAPAAEAEEPPAGAPSITQLPGALQSPFKWDPLESTCRHASLSIL